MKVSLTTVYQNVNQEWLDWWLNRLASFPENEIVVEELKECGYAVYASKDPTSDIVGTTTYRIEQ